MFKTGKITEQIYNAIHTHDLCIVVLAFNNPNVYYELAVAQCAVRPVIILIEVGKELPFDLKDERSVFYDLSIPSYEDRIYITQVIKIIENLEATEWNVSSSIPGFSPITTKKEVDLQYFEKSINYRKWSDILNDTEEIFYIMGISLDAWVATQNLSEILVEKAKNNCKVKILLLHKDNPALSDLINDELTQKKRERFLYMVDYNWKRYSEIAENHENIEVRRLKIGTMTHSKYINDNYGFYIPYFYSKISNTTPLWKCRQGTYLYKILLDDFDLIWKLSE